MLSNIIICQTVPNPAQVATVMVSMLLDQLILRAKGKYMLEIGNVGVKKKDYYDNMVSNAMFIILLSVRRIHIWYFCQSFHAYQ